MKKRPFASVLATLLMLTLVAPSAFLVTPRQVHAIPVTVVGDIVGWVQQTITAVESTITAIATPISAAAEVAQEINAYVLQPLAFVLSGNLLKMITAGVIKFVIGQTNGTGVPQFVVDVQQSLQTVGDAKAMGFFNQFGRNSNSPFASAITSSLRNNYLSKTSLAGFWAENMNTLARSSPNVNAYLAGNWSQGGVGAWFALTTQIQNNPYTFYQTSQSQLSSLVGPGVGGATGARLAELGWGNGFTSWCGATSTVPPDAQRQVFDDGSTLITDSTGGTTATNAIGINPGDPCIDSDGNPGTVKTPGSVIVATLNKALGSQQDSILRMGNVGPQITSILRDVGTIMSTVNFATQLLGDASLGGATGGLLGANQPSGSNQSPLRAFAPTTPSGVFNPSASYLGASNSSVYQDAAASAVASTDPLGRITQYESAWNTIRTSANAASTSVRSLATFCATAADDAETNPTLLTTPAFITAANEQAAAALTALSTTIAPVLARAAAIAPIVAAARAMVARVQCEAHVPAGTSVSCDPSHPTVMTDSITNTYSADVLTLQSMPPTARDIANALQDAQNFGGAEASPAGSLNVSGSSLVDQMNLLSTNAEALKTSVCTPTTSTYSTF